MKCLIVEDEFTSRMQLKYFLEKYGNCDIAVNGKEAVEAFITANSSGKPYDLICLDIKLPEKDGHKVLKEIRKIEKEINKSPDNPSRVFMTTALSDVSNIENAYHELCDEYLIKPVVKEKLDEMLKKYDLI